MLDATLTLPDDRPGPDDPTEVGVTGTITEWKVVDNGNITIH